MWVCVATSLSPDERLTPMLYALRYKCWCNFYCHSRRATAMPKRRPLPLLLQAAVGSRHLQVQKLIEACDRCVSLCTSSNNHSSHMKHNTNSSKNKEARKNRRLSSEYKINELHTKNNNNKTSNWRQHVRTAGKTAKYATTFAISYCMQKWQEILKKKNSKTTTKSKSVATPQPKKTTV